MKATKDKQVSAQNTKSPAERKPPRDGSRRRFLNTFLTGSVMGFFAAAFYPLWRYLTPPAEEPDNVSSVIAASVNELKPNSGKVFRFGSEPAIVIRTPRGDLKAFTAVCTHLSCTVQYRPDLQHIWCACHNGHYDLNGKNISGPPPRPLQEYKVNVISDDIWVLKT